MNSNLTLWDPPMQVNIAKSYVEKGSVIGDRVSVTFGEWPGSAHNTWFLWETELDKLIANLLAAKMQYDKEKG